MKMHKNLQLTLLPNLSGTTGEDLTFTLTNLTGRQLRADCPWRMAEGFNAYPIDVTGVQPGVCFVSVFTAATKTVTNATISQEA